MPSHLDGAELANIQVSKIRRNEENPRIIFRQDEMNRLMDSILENGVMVPVTVFKKGQAYVLIDGERRWRSCRKLNLKTIPAIIEQEPSKLENITKMFMIHALREQWDLLTIALKLKDLIALFEKEHKRPPKRDELARMTGLPRGTIERCRLLLNLPQKYHLMILKELEKPKPKQRLTEDFFIEMERALKTVSRRMPEAVPNIDKVRGVLIGKFRKDVIDNRVHFRKLSKIARAENVEADPDAAKDALVKLFSKNSYSIQAAYHDTVEPAYEERDISTRLASLIERLRGVDDVDDELKILLEQLKEQAERLLGDADGA
ncbi:MAG: ParB/RepB/Spo0J family partition protein [Pseudomonadota bacterium]